MSKTFVHNWTSIIEKFPTFYMNNRITQTVSYVACSCPEVDDVTSSGPVSLIKLSWYKKNLMVLTEVMAKRREIMAHWDEYRLY